MRDVKAKPAVSTLKTVHTNYFLEGVFPLDSLSVGSTVTDSTAGERSHFHSQGTLGIPFPFSFTVKA